MRLAHNRTLVSRTVMALLAALLLAFSLAACGSSDSSSESGDASASSDSKDWPRTIQTDDGELTLDKQPEKIVSTSTTLTGSLLAIDAPVVASAATSPNVPDLSDDKGFFNQWSDVAKDKGVEKLWANDSPNVEKAADYDPDLIVVSKNSGDSVFDKVDQLKQIAPVLVVDYSDASWQDVTTKLAEATGHESNAENVIKDFDDKVEKAKGEITVPEDAVSPFIVFGDGSGAAALTTKAPQVQILEQLGFSITEIPEEVKGDTSMGKDRGDMVNLSMENVQKGLPGKVWIVIGADDTAKSEIKDNKAFNTSDAVKNNQVYYTPGETFRLDYYSAQMELESLQKDFAK